MKQIYLRLRWMVLLSILTIGVYAQTNVTGTVTDGNGEPLIGATILVKGTTIGANTDFDGKFSLSAPEGSEELEISYLGYRTQVVDLLDNITIVLEEDVNQLDEVVVTGFATTVKRSNLANAVASISAKELTGVTPQTTIDGALYGKFKGADIRANSGAPGGGFSIRLRGVTSVFLNQQPQYIIDGVYVDNSSISLGTDIVTAAAGGGNTATNQDDASNRIADLIPEDIESIEILKGASAAAIYGVGGAGGVVVIKTKSGKYNQGNRISFSQTLGFSAPTRLLGTRAWDRAKVAAEFGEADAVLFDQNGNNDYESEIYDNRPLQAISALSISGGSQNTKYFVSATYRDQGGLVDNTGYNKASIRANIGQKIGDKFELGVSTSYIYADADRGLFNNSNSNTTIGYAMAFTKPWENLFADENGNYPAGSAGSNPLETIALSTNQERVNRFIGGINMMYDIYTADNQTLKLGAELGLDQYTLRTRGLFPQTLSFYRDPGSLRGVSIAGSAFTNRKNMSAFLVHSYFTESNINFRTQAGVIQLDENQDVITTVASGLNGSQENVDQAENFTVGQTRTISTVKGAFLQEEINVDDKFILTAGIRADKSTNNGDPNEVFWSPKANFAINIHNLTDLSSTPFSQVKPRLAFGQSYRFPGFADRFNALDPGEVEGSAGLFTNALRGNIDVSPEKQTELEFGVDLGFIDNRILFTATYYIKSVDDLLLRAQQPASSGFANKVVNAGELENKGLELGLETEVVKTADLSWALGLNWWKNQSEVTRLDIPAFNTGGFAAFLGQGRIEEGSSATQLIGSIDPSQCNGDDCSNVDPEGDGFMAFGDMEADFNLSWTNSITYKGFELNWLLHWKQGGDGINLSTLLYDLGNLTWDYDDTNLDPSGALSNGDYRLSALGVHPDVYIEDAGYVRLREIGLYYNIGGNDIAFARNLRLGISARNLVNIFDYNSYDPEVSNFGNNVLINSVEVTPYPASKTFNFHINVTF